MPWRRRSVISGMLVLVLALAPSCGLRHHTVANRKGTLTITPASGKPGTSFALMAGAFLPGEGMTFEIDLPNKTKFVGPVHIADPQGTVASAYVPASADPPGVYQVLAVGNEGTKAQASLTVTP